MHKHIVTKLRVTKVGEEAKLKVSQVMGQYLIRYNFSMTEECNPWHLHNEIFFMISTERKSLTYETNQLGIYRGELEVQSILGTQSYIIKL